MKGVEELEDTGRRNGHASEEEFFEWEKSPTPPPRERSDVALFRPPEDEDDKGDFEDEEQPDFEREMEGYADMVSRLNNRSLADIREEAERDVTTLTAMRNAEQRNADGVTRQMASDIKVSSSVLRYLPGADVTAAGTSSTFRHPLRRRATGSRSRMRRTLSARFCRRHHHG